MEHPNCRCPRDNSESTNGLHGSYEFINTRDVLLSKVKLPHCRRTRKAPWRIWPRELQHDVSALRFYIESGSGDSQEYVILLGQKRSIRGDPHR